MKTFTIEYRKLGSHQLEVEVVKARSTIMAIKEVQKRTTKTIRVLKITVWNSYGKTG